MELLKICIYSSNFLPRVIINIFQDRRRNHEEEKGHLGGTAGRSAQQWGRTHGRGGVQAPLPLILVYPVSFCFWQL